MQILDELQAIKVEGQKLSPKFKYREGLIYSLEIC